MVSYFAFLMLKVMVIVRPVAWRCYIYVVTRLDDPASKPEGTLRYAVEKSGARTVVFAISGTIMLERELKTKNDNLTIAGQTSPGGITT